MMSVILSVDDGRHPERGASPKLSRRTPSFEDTTMPMIDVYAAAGTFQDKRKLLQELNDALMRWEKVPRISLFLDNTAAFLHELPADSLATARGQSHSVRVQILTPVGTLDREKKLGVTKELTDIVAAAAGDPSLVQRTWVLIAEAPDGGWGMQGHAFTNAEILEAARRELSGKQGG
jgi:phenylpyruvate tautomerase PptA (4-oxalocrotonate tautomerase family)